MDKETLSNYGWIVICVLVLAVMIALATPFGDFIANGVKSTTQGLFNTNQRALNSTGIVIVKDQNFEQKKQEPCAVFSGYYDDEWNWISEEVKVTWEELRTSGTKYDCESSRITDTAILEAFGPCNYLVSIIIPEGITTIEDESIINTFELKSVTLPNTLTSIGNHTFSYAELPSLHIPANVTNIAEYAFESCNIGTITVDPNNKNYCSVDGVLYTKDMTKLISFPVGKTGKFIIPNTVTDINAIAFEFAKITEVVIPHGVTHIPLAVFAGSEIKTITLPNSITNIDSCIVADCYNLEGIIFNGTIEQWDNITKSDSWHYYCHEITVTCTDGTVTIPIS